MGSLSGQAERLQILRTVAFGYGVRHIGHGLWRLADRHRCDGCIGQGIDLSIAATASAFSSPT